MHIFKFIIASCFLLCVVLMSNAQPNPNVIYDNNIKTVQFYSYGDQESMPICKVKSTDRLELHFDDIDTRVKSYYYAYELCDYNWQPVNVSPFDFIKGFTQQRITSYRFSSLANTRYIHYQVVLPEANSLPTRSGNYLLRVFLDGDTSRTVFTRGMLVLGSRSSVSAQMIKPLSPGMYNTHQQLKFTINVEGIDGSNISQQIKIVVLQNHRWDNALGNVPATFIRNNSMEFSNPNAFLFAADNEWRWLDLRSFLLLSDRVDSANTARTDVYVKPDKDRSRQGYAFYSDLDGGFIISTYESINPLWQGDYANVHFKFVTPTKQPYAGKDLYLIGQLTDYGYNENTKMQFNAEKGYYETTRYLKQGYYSYGYTLVDKDNPENKSTLEGDYWETENRYTILVYYKSFTDQADHLIGVSNINTRNNRPGFSF